MEHKFTWVYDPISDDAEWWILDCYHKAFVEAMRILPNNGQVAKQEMQQHGKINWISGIKHWFREKPCTARVRGWKDPHDESCFGLVPALCAAGGSMVPREILMHLAARVGDVCNVSSIMHGRLKVIA